MPVHALIFDLDGTLADSLTDIADAMNAALAVHSLPQHPTDAYRLMVGEGVKMLVARAVGAARVPVETVLETYQRDALTRALVALRFPTIPFLEVRGEREGVPRKPDPTAAFEMALALNVLPANIGFVGDTAVDMTVARAAGMRAIGVLWGFRDRGELEGAKAHEIISQPRQLLSLVG